MKKRIHPIEVFLMVFAALVLTSGAVALHTQSELADKVKIELNTGVSPAIIVPVEGEENFLYMVLPVRLKSAE